MGIFNRKKADNTPKSNQYLDALHSDWKLIVATISESIKTHWNTLETKFEQNIEYDDYGQQFIDDSFGREIIYFSHKVTLPKIKTIVKEGSVKASSFALLPMFQPVDNDVYGIRYEDTATEIADKYISGLLDEGRGNPLGDEMLSRLYTGELDVNSETLDSNSIDVTSQTDLPVLEFRGELQPYKPIKINGLGSVVFRLFYAMYSSRPEIHKPIDANSAKDYKGNDPYQYEGFIKNILREAGFKTRKTPGSGDYGVDVLATKNKSYAIQCKLYNHPVGTKAIQEIISGKLYYKADFALVVSDNKFTEAAKSLAKRTNVVLTHHKDIVSKMEQLDAQPTTRRTAEQYGGQPAQKSITESKEWTDEDAEELITVIMPTIKNDD